MQSIYDAVSFPKYLQLQRFIPSKTTVGPCEREGRKKIVTNVKAGDRLKVGWTSNNHAGGWVRLALVPEGSLKFDKTFAKIVFNS